MSHSLTISICSSGLPSHSWLECTAHRKRSCCGAFLRGRIQTGLGAGRHCRLGRTHFGIPHRVRRSDPVGGRRAGGNDDCRLLWSTRCSQPGLALAASIPQPAGWGQRVRVARRRGYNPLVHLRRHHRCPRQPQVGGRAVPIQEGDPLEVRLRLPCSSEALHQGSMRCRSVGCRLALRSERRPYWVMSL